MSETFFIESIHSKFPHSHFLLGASLTHFYASNIHFQPFGEPNKKMNRVSFIFSKYFSLAKEYGLTPSFALKSVFVCMEALPWKNILLHGFSLVPTFAVFLDPASFSQTPIPPQTVSSLFPHRLRHFFSSLSRCW